MEVYYAVDHETLRWVHRRKERIRLRCQNAEERTRTERDNIWQSATSLDILPGLPDELVEMKIWPILRRMFEAVEDLSDDSCERHILQI